MNDTTPAIRPFVAAVPDEAIDAFDLEWIPESAIA